MVALKDGLALIALVLFFGALFTLMSGSGDPANMRDGALLLDLDGVIVEQPEDIDPLTLIQGAGPSFTQYRASDVIRALEVAAKDDDIKTVVLNLDGFMGGGQVVLQDVAAAIDKVKAAKKPVLAYATGYYDDSYLLAAHASEIWLNPMGAALFAGPGGSSPYFKGLLDQYGVNVKVYRVGKFKSFVEPFTRDGQSDEARAANQELVDALWEDWQSHVRAARPAANFAALLKDPASVAAGKGLAQSALDLKIVDKLADETAFGKYVASKVGADDDEGPADYNRTDLASYLVANPEDSSGDGVAVVTIAGEITDGEAGAGSAGGDTVERHVHAAIANDDVKALVVRIDSPGGSALASEKMRLAVQAARAKKLPVIVSFGNVAASGGYWAAMASDKIYAEPATITGSIGVFGIIPTFENTLAKYGVKSDGVRTTPLSGQPDILAGTSPETDRMIQASVEDIYGRFTTMVAAARKLPLARVQEVAQGRVWAGGAARQIGLVDAFGSLDDAVAEAAKRAGLDAKNIRRIEIDDGQGFLSWVLSGFSAHAEQLGSKDLISQISARNQALAFAGFRDAARVMTGPAVQVRCMSCPSSPALAKASDRSKTLFSGIFR
jgi:protease IV